MRLWTIQHYPAYEKMLQTGRLTASEERLFWEEEFGLAYDWMAQKMHSHGLIAPKGVHKPIWVWYQWEGKRKSRRIRGNSHQKGGEKMVQLTIEVSDKEILLSDFDLFHYVLNYWYLPLNETDETAFEKEYTALGFGWHDLRDNCIQTKEMDRIREKIQKSWERIFDLEREDKNIIYGFNRNKSIQGTIWELRLDHVQKAEIFFEK